MRLTAQGWIHASIAVFVSGIGHFFGSTPILFLGLSLIAVLLVAVLDQLMALQQLRIVRISVAHEVTPARPSAGDDAIITTTIANWDWSSRILKRTLRPMVWLHSELTGRQHHGRTHPVFSHSVEPAPTLSTSTYSHLTRGIWHVRKIHAVRMDYLGCSRITIESEIDVSLIVWPHSWQLSGTAQAWGVTQPRAGNQAPNSNPEDSTLREYVVGDDLRRVHWASSARLGQLLVRHVDNHQGGQISIIIDMGIPETDLPGSREGQAASDRFFGLAAGTQQATDSQESAISVTSSIILWSAQLGHEVSLTICGNQTHEDAIISQDGRAIGLLDQLASAQSRRMNTEYMTELINAVNNPTTTGLLVFVTAAHSPSRIRHALREDKRGSGRPTLCIVVADPDDQSARMLTEELAGYHHRALYIDAGHVEKYLGRLAEVVQ